MQRVMLKAKIHRATLTATELHYEGSVAVDRLLLEQADILPGEQVHVLNVNNGERIVTYAVVSEEERVAFTSRTVYVDAQNYRVVPQRRQPVLEGEG